ncbi:MAG TPA: MFS transporter [Terracidiphilus sp.]|nr:MFS transporter [Terracidiphilus sp.]
MQRSESSSAPPARASQVPQAPQVRERPWLIAFLIAPTAVIDVGLVGGALAFLLRREGVNPAQGAALIAFLTIPHTIYFLWCPVTDFWVRRRTWILLAAVAAAATMLAAFHQPRLSSPWALRLIFLSYCLGLLAAAGCGGIMGTFVSEANRRRAASAYQAGSLAFSALAVFTLTGLAGRVSLPALGWVMAAFILLPALVAFALPATQTPSAPDFRNTLRRIAREFKVTFLRLDAIPYILLITMPMCSGAMIGLLPALATDFGVSATEVAWLNGLAGALLTMLGTLIVALIPVRIRPPVAFLLAGLANAASLAIMALGPQRPAIYFTATVLYLITIGACWALFTGVALDFLGDSGKSGGARYSIINSLGNLPITYMAFVDGRGYAHWGPRGMPAIDAILSATAASLLLIYFLAHHAPRRVAAA